MTSAPIADPTPQPSPKPRKPLRLWPGVVLVVLQWLARFGLPVVNPEYAVYGMLATLATGVLILLWWLFFSRAPWLERLGAVVLMALALFATRPLLHESIATGAMGMLFNIMVVPGLCLALVVWAVVSGRLTTGPRWAALVAVLAVVCGGWALVRTGGFSGDFKNDFAWRWSPTPEERLLAQEEDEPEMLPVAPPATEAMEEPPTEIAEESAPESTAEPTEEAATESTEEAVTGPVAEPEPKPAAWPGFRGPERDGILPGVQIATDWKASPPVELWRRPVGPGWSSFAVRGDLVYTQEQRGEDEVVAAYKATTGEPVWRHRDAARFWESNAGAGPRGTPTLDGDRVYTLGGTGILNALQADNGTVVWSRDAAADTGAKTPYWGFSGSPLVVDGVVIIAASGTLAAYDRDTGEPRWSGPKGGEGYSSPQLLTIGGVPQVLMLRGEGLVSVLPADGTVLWEYAWKGYPIVQPALTPGGDVLIAVDQASGLRRLAVTQGPGGWTVEERWTTTGLKPYFNDFVVHEGHVYGFDGRILACIDLETGERRWKGGRYGNGQLILLPDEDVLLVLSEEGDLALVSAKPDAYTELASAPAIQGKTWNHPALAGDLLLVRNDQEMAAFRVAPAGK